MKSILTICLICIGLNGFSQWKTKDVTTFQKEINEWYASKEHSPFKGDAQENFEHLNFFPINEDFIVKATFHQAKKKKERTFGTSSGSNRKMIEYGTVEFELKGKSYSLVVLESLNKRDPEYADYLTLGFFDKTNGKSTYGGGRYLGLWKNELIDGEFVMLNFNLAYHPYCAYTKGYSCLIPPLRNKIKTKVKAGIKNGIVFKK